MTIASISALSDAKLAALRKKSYEAFHNAKQRCENPKNPSYPKYGMLGVKVIFAGFGEFLDHIGLPPNDQSQLDRIDPAGNYELGNVRWASPSVQAVNKKFNPLSSTLSISQQKSALIDMANARARREALAEVWRIVVDAINRGGFTAADIEFLVGQKLPPSMFEAGWEPGQIRDLAEPPSYFFMPSLTQLEKRIRIVGGPLPTTPGANDGVVRGLEILLGSALDAVKKPFATHDNGAVLIGGKSQAWLTIGGVEGIMMVAASRMKANSEGVTFLPLIAALEQLRELGSSYKWHEVASRVLDCRSLFIPDLQIEYGVAVQPKHKEWSLLAALIDYRIEYGKKTYFGVQNFNNVPGFVKDKLLLSFHLRELPEAPATPSGPNHIASGPKIGTRGFADVRAAIG